MIPTTVYAIMWPQWFGEDRDSLLECLNYIDSKIVTLDAYGIVAIHKTNTKTTTKLILHLQPGAEDKFNELGKRMELGLGPIPRKPGPLSDWKQKHVLWVSCPYCSMYQGQSRENIWKSGQTTICKFCSKEILLGKENNGKSTNIQGENSKGEDSSGCSCGVPSVPDPFSRPSSCGCDSESAVQDKD